MDPTNPNQPPAPGGGQGGWTPPTGGDQQAPGGTPAPDQGPAMPPPPEPAPDQGPVNPTTPEPIPTGGGETGNPGTPA